MKHKAKARQITDRFYKLQIENQIQITKGKTPCWDYAKQEAELHCDMNITLFENEKHNDIREYYVKVKKQIPKL